MARERRALCIREALERHGREIGDLDAGATVRCTGAQRPAHIATLGPRDFHQVLKAKFGLADR